MGSDAELVHADVPPTLHRRADGVMLRWNTTRAGGPYYVRVTSPDPDLPFSMVAVAPPVYLQAPVDPKSWPTGARERAELSASAGSAVPVDLGFAFPFVGLAYDRVWVSSAGYLAFERPPATEGFVGLDAVHSAVVVAAGEYDLAHPGATLAVSRFGATEVEVAWHAPLYGSSKLTDVALKTNVNQFSVVHKTKKVAVKKVAAKKAAPAKKAAVKKVAAKKVAVKKVAAKKAPTAANPLFPSRPKSKRIGGDIRVRSRMGLSINFQPFISSVSQSFPP
jgi:hypothetical protein